MRTHTHTLALLFRTPDKATGDSLLYRSVSLPHFLTHSSLYRDVAIVSPIAGTTRDVLEVALNLSGFPVLIADTAGLRDSADIIEQEGIKRGKKRYARREGDGERERGD